jgi:hypothetical protein
MKVNRIRSLVWATLSCAAIGSALSTPTRAENYVIDTDVNPTSHFLDRWMYPFNGSPGVRSSASTFNALGSAPFFDERDAQYLLAFNTGGVGVPTGQGASNYVITSARLRITEQGIGGYTFDGTVDPFQSFLDPSAPNYVEDTDAGTPLELFATGFRGGYTQFGWPDGAVNTPAPVFSAGSPFGPSGQGTRNVFAANPNGQDISNHIDYMNDGAAGYEPVRLSVGQASVNGVPLNPGDPIPQGGTITFDFDLSNPAVVAYLQGSLDKGQLGLMVSSLHTAAFGGGGEPFPQFATAQNAGFPIPVFEVSTSVVPEPSTVALAAIAGIALVVGPARRRIATLVSRR